MGKLTIDDLKIIREKESERIALRLNRKGARVTVHLGTCGIAAGARDVMTALLEEIDRAGSRDIYVFTSGCSGNCEGEPHVKVEVGGGAPVTYRDVTPEKMRAIFSRHLENGEAVNEWAA